MMRGAGVLTAAFLLAFATAAYAQSAGQGAGQAAANSSQACNASGVLSCQQVIGVLKSSDEAEIALAYFAMPKLTTNEAKSFARRMIMDHGNDLGNVTQRAGALNLVPQESNITEKLRNDTRDAMTNLTNLTGAAADRFYMEYEAHDHVEDLNTGSTVLQPSAKNTEVAQLVQNTRQLVSTHLQVAITALQAINPGLDLSRYRLALQSTNRSSTNQSGPGNLTP
jgi:putative membrane protein